MNLIAKIAEKVADKLEVTPVDENTRIARATSIPLGVRRTKAQMETLKKF